jgi:hypothetical protein
MALAGGGAHSMTTAARLRAPSVALALLALAPIRCLAADAPAEGTVATTCGATAYYYSMRDQPDFTVGIATLDRGPLHLEARYNYEAQNAGSAFVGWTFSGGKEITWEITPIAGAMFGAARGFVPGVEATLGWRDFDAYVEAEYVDNRAEPGTRYWYAWTEIGWKPVEWLRVGLAAQRTRTVASSLALQRGVLAQLIYRKLTLSAYAFNPDNASRYAIFALGVQF